VLVMHDLIGLSTGRVPRFVRAYAGVKASISDALARWRDDVEHRRFPGPNETLG
jgi:3-methyl-2-oxobutanoate hydroxymethyltransferase